MIYTGEKVRHHASSMQQKQMLVKKKRILLIGPPNTGKSTLFHKLTGRYAWTANFPGTTVDVEMGVARINGEERVVIDLPGFFALSPLSEDQKIAKRILLESTPETVVVFIVPALELDTYLPTFLVVRELGLPTVLAVNMVDEAREKGYHINTRLLSRMLGVPVVATVATTGEGVGELIAAIDEASRVKPKPLLSLPKELEGAVRLVESRLTGNYHPFSRRGVALLLLLGDRDAERLVEEREASTEGLLQLVWRLHNSGYSVSLGYHLRETAKSIVSRAVARTYTIEGFKQRFLRHLDNLLLHPVTGSLAALGVLVALYYFVGVFGAGYVVDLLEGLWEERLNPLINAYLSPLPRPLYLLLAGDYGVLTLALRYGIALLLPIVGFFFIAFSVMEDLGYLTRLSILLDKLFRRVGLNGRAVVPMVLGLGCVAMATLSTRVLGDRKQRLVAIAMLSVAIPCSAQQGVVFALLPGLRGLLVWLATVAAMLLVAAYFSTKLLGAPRTGYVTAIPPLRLPRPRTVLMKTWLRLRWYFVEVIPLFILASVLIWAGSLTGVLDGVVNLVSYPVKAMGLPEEASNAFIYGFFRRDYGAAGLFDVRELLTDRQLVVASVAITLFVPCIAQVLVMVREFGWKASLAIYAATILIGFSVGMLLNHVLAVIGF